MIAKANQHGVFKDVIDWEVKGKAETLSVTAYGVLRTTGKRAQVTCDMEMAKKEGWTKNAKYQSIPEQMLRYRSAAFLIRLYCPEVMVGVPSAIEIEMEAKDITPDGGPVIIEANDEAPVEGSAEPAKDQPAPAAKSRVDAQKEFRREQQAAPKAEVKEQAAPQTEASDKTTDAPEEVEG